METGKKYYKVLRKNGKSLYARGYYALKYKVGQWMKPKIGKIFILPDLYSAKIWRDEGDIIWECRAKGVIHSRNEIPPPPFSLFPSRKIKKFWSKGILLSPDNLSLKYTLWADEVMLARKVEESEVRDEKPKSKSQ